LFTLAKKVKNLKFLSMPPPCKVSITGIIEDVTGYFIIPVSYFFTYMKSFSSNTTTGCTIFPL